MNFDKKTPAILSNIAGLFPDFGRKKNAVPPPPPTPVNKEESTFSITPSDSGSAPGPISVSPNPALTNPQTLPNPEPSPTPIHEPSPQPTTTAPTPTPTTNKRKIIVDTTSASKTTPNNGSDVIDEESKKIVELINQGAYGCVYRPEISCNGEIGDAYYVTKVQKSSATVRSEIHLGSAINRMNNSIYFFAPISDSCPIEISTLDKLGQSSNCNVVDSFKQNAGNTTMKSLVSTKIRYVNGDNLEKYMSSLPKEVLPHKLVSTFNCILMGIEKLLDAGIVHNDIKENNIMYDLAYNSPIIIDFGLSYVPVDTNTKELQESAFYTMEMYPYWTFEIKLLSYITKKVRKTQAPAIVENPNVTETKIKELADDYIDKQYEFISKYTNNAFNDEDVNKWKKEVNEFYVSKFVGKTYEDMFTEIFKPEYYSTWDVYSLCVCYITFGKILNIKTGEDPVIDNLMQICKENILAAPDKRKTPAQMLAALNSSLINP